MARDAWRLRDRAERRCDRVVDTPKLIFGVGEDRVRGVAAAKERALERERTTRETRRLVESSAGAMLLGAKERSDRLDPRVVRARA